MRWIGHAGLAIDRPGGTPTRTTINEARRLAVDWLEIDVCVSADAELVLRHDAALSDGRGVETVTLEALRVADPDLLTMDEAAEAAGDMPLLIDLKGAATTRPLARWLATRPATGALGVCTDDVEALLHVRETAPGVARWLTLPVVGSGRGERLRRISAAVRRSSLPARLATLAGRAGAAAISVDHWAVTAALCTAARRLSLPVAAWTVNSPAAARRAVRCGADYITTDRVAEMRAATLGGVAGAGHS